VNKPPTPPFAVLIVLVVCLGLFFFSQRYALILFSAVLGSLMLGSLVGYGVFAWKPTFVQLLLTVAMLAETYFGWNIEKYYLDD
jgi:hypothetical protein